MNVSNRSLTTNDCSIVVIVVELCKHKHGIFIIVNPSTRENKQKSGETNGFVRQRNVLAN